MMKLPNVWKYLLAAAAMSLTLNIPNALAGATNRGDNTTATPGNESTTTMSPDDPNVHRDETQNMDNKNMKNKRNRSDMGRDKGSSSSGSSDSSNSGESTNSNSGNTDSSSGSSNYNR